MRRNAIVAVSRQTDWISSIWSLSERHDLEIKYWITYDENHDRVKETFPNTICHNRIDFNRGIAHPGYEALQLENNSKIEYHQAHETYIRALEILDRFDLDDSITLFERKRLIDKMFNYCLQIVQVLHIDFGLFGQSPHSTGTFVLYSALKLLNRRVAVVTSTGLDDIHYIADDINFIPQRIVDRYHEILRDGCSGGGLSEDCLTAIEEVRKASSAYIPWYVEAVGGREQKHRPIVTKIEELMARGKRPLLRFDASQCPFPGSSIRPPRKIDHEKTLPRTFKIPGRSFSGSRITVAEYKNYRDWAYTKKVSIRREYEDLIVEPDFDRPYIYFAMHFQPERTTVPDGRNSRICFGAHRCCTTRSQRDTSLS